MKKKNNNKKIMKMLTEKNITVSMGNRSGMSFSNDPIRLTFTLSRYKFVAKMFAGFQDVLEVGCGDAWPSRIVAQSVGSLTVSDFDPIFIDDAKSRHEEKWPMEYLVHNFIESTTASTYDGIYLCDVFEHISPKDEHSFLENAVSSLKDTGSMIIGIPSLESQDLIEPDKRDPGHVNCKSGPELKSTIEKFFHNVFLFSMNDEIVHTGHHKMAHYLFCLACNPK